MKLTHGLISADDRVQETPETWTAYISSQKWGDLIPHLEERDDGSQFWVVAGQNLDDRPLAETGALMPDRNQLPHRWEDVPAAAYDPAQRLRAMDADGVDAQVLYPGMSGGSGEVLGAISDPVLQLACVQAYNNWLIDAWAKKSPRFIPQCLVPINDPNAAATEAARAIELGHRGVILPGTPWNLQDVPHINDDAWDPSLDRLPGQRSPRLLELRSDPEATAPGLGRILSRPHRRHQRHHRPCQQRPHPRQPPLLPHPHPLPHP